MENRLPAKMLLATIWGLANAPSQPKASNQDEPEGLPQPPSWRAAHSSLPEQMPHVGGSQKNFSSSQYTEAVVSPQTTSTSLRILLRMDCRALQLLTAESQKRAWSRPARGLIQHGNCSTECAAATAAQSAFRLLPGLSNKQMRFVRRRNGIVSRTAICLTIKAKLAISTSGRVLSSRRVQWSVSMPLLLRSGATARANTPSVTGGRACSILDASLRQAWKTWYSGSSSSLSRCQTRHRSFGSNNVSPLAAIPQALQVSERRILGTQNRVKAHFPDFRVDPRPITGRSRSSSASQHRAPCP